ncbi:DEAD/DEAH box helicase [Desulfofundulus thermobenzoicus]|uniref:DEAD/DEAH box helicase n=1 Tax=Desulfofundulus thermobenzoicus TaxID=29376 RepID=UPI00128E9C23
MTGTLAVKQKKNIIKNCQVIIMTPDIIHAWLLANIGDKEIMKFVASILLVVVDEVHTYTGVFGSNSAFLFRRLRHLMAVADNSPQFICASATIANPEVHLKNLFGVQFYLIGSELDTSPRYEVEILLVKPPRIADF